jgi:sulfoxide reductase catalytic subunit YedY
MLIRTRRGWEIPESKVTSEAAVLGRRGVLAAGLGAGLIAGPAQAQWNPFGSAAKVPAQPLKPLKAKRNTTYPAGRAVTDEKDATSYNNFYEFSEDKSLVGPAQAMKLDPWSVEISGLVKTPRKIGLEDLLKQVSLEERIYRHRCVEAWAMTVPWIGFPLADLVKLAEPLAGAKYVAFTSLADPKTMVGLSKSWYPWPFMDSITLEEAGNELSFLTVGMYGKTTPPQNGAPIRLTTPWKYGFKQVKSIVKVDFVAERPVGFWEKLQDSEYGFWANVNPAVPHPRWSQAYERLLGSDEKVPTQIWNGYGEFVSAMYVDKKNERLFA